MIPQVSDSPTKRRIALIADLHIGSNYAIMPCPFVTHDGKRIYPNQGQRQINQVFKWCADVMKYWHVDSIIFLGDLIQGSNKAELSRDLVTADLEEQQDMCIDYLTPICRNRKVIGISGTNYHKSQDTEIEKDIIEGLNGKFYDKMAWIKVEGTNRILNISHASAKSNIYPVSAMEREAVQMLKAYGSGKFKDKPDVIIRGHRHVFAHVHTTAFHFVLVPSFQVWYPFQTAYYGALQSDIGICILFIDAKNRIIIHHYTASQPINIGDRTHVF